MITDDLVVAPTEEEVRGVAAGEGPSRAVATWRAAVEANVERVTRLAAETTRSADGTAEAAEAERLRGQVARDEERTAEIRRELAEREERIARATEAAEELARQAEDLARRRADAEAAEAEARRQLGAVQARLGEAVTEQERFAGLLRARDPAALKTTGDVAAFLKEIGLGAHVDAFAAEGVTGAALELLTDGNLRNTLGVFSFEERKRFRHALMLLRAGGIVRLPAATLSAAGVPPGDVLWVASWTREDVGRWVTNIAGLPSSWRRALESAGVVGEVLLHMTGANVEELFEGTKLGDRLVFESKVGKLREEYFAAIRSRDAAASSGTALAADADADAAASASAAAAAPTVHPPIPEEYLCPITQEVMRDPVLADDGFIYEQAAIARWLETKDTSPMTGAPLASKQLRRVNTLRSAISSWASGSRH